MANEQIGRMHGIGIAKETTYGTVATTQGNEGSYWYPRLEGELSPQVEYAMADAGIQRREMMFDGIPVKNSSLVSLKTYAMSRSAGALFNAALGTRSVATATTGAWTHTFTVLNTPSLPSYTVIGKDNLQTKGAPGSRLNTLEIEASNEDIPTIAAEFVGMQYQATTETVSLSNQDYIFRPADITVKRATTVGGLTGASTFGVESVKITLDNKVEPRYDLGTTSPALIVPVGGLEGSIELVVRYNSTAFEQLFVDGTKQAIGVYFNQAGTTIGSASSPYISLEFDSVLFDERDNPKDNDDLMVETLTGKILYDRTNANAITVKLVTDTKTY